LSRESKPVIACENRTVKCKPRLVWMCLTTEDLDLSLFDPVFCILCFKVRQVDRNKDRVSHSSGKFTRNAKGYSVFAAKKLELQTQPGFHENVNP
jgi:hypothetical protein